MLSLINGRNYDWSMVNFLVAGIPTYGVKSIEYTEAREKELTYGVGSMPNGIGFGRYTATGSITVTMNQLQALKSGSPTGRLIDLPLFNIVVQYLNLSIVTPGLPLPTKDTLVSCQFLSEPVVLNENDKVFDIKLDLLITEIISNDNALAILGVA